MKISQLLNLYAIDTAQTELMQKTAEKYLRDHGIVDAEIEKISQKLLKKQIREKQIRSLLLEFHIKGMEKIINKVEKGEDIPDFEVLYDQFKNQIEELL